ncbi:MAG TPA: cytochrome P450 [Kiritimatiellia bacterium]|nr:cytochrome P450 [Kiritimatiellia bacterium]HMP34782.1 cytochrome P450 [Kiritimatiellia bacterium]
MTTCWPMVNALARGVVSRHPLPPGRLIALDAEERKNQRLLLELAARHGPVFKAVAWGQLWVCVVGLDRCTRFIHEHKGRIRPATIDVTRLYPEGFLRQMRGEAHRRSRKALVLALRDEAVAQQTDALAGIAATRLAGYARRFPAGSALSVEALIATLSEIASVQLIRVFFGEPDGSPLAERLLAGFRALGPHGLVWNQGPRQEAAFHALRTMIRDDLRERPAAVGGVVRRLHAAGALDEAMLGHAIMMVEMGRYDMKGFYRWLLRYAGQHPATIDRIADEPDAEPAAGNSRARAFVLETFRMDQSERLIRRAEQDLVFDGFIIPRHAMIRLCLWESHKSEVYFPEPFVFNPERFRDGDLPADRFAPFGLDEHYCPLADVAIRLGVLLVREVARRYRIESVGDGAPIRGAYGWEPAPTFTVRLYPREEPA